MLHREIVDYEHVIWDWNGTLLHDIDLVMDILRRQMLSYGLKVPSQQEYRQLFGFPIRSFYQRLGFPNDDRTFTDLSKDFNAEYNKRYQEAALFDGVPQILATVNSAGKTQSVLSAAEQNHLHEAVAAFGLADFFHHIYGLDNHYGASKIDRGRQLIERSMHAPEATLLIGDTDHDLEVGREMGIDVLLVCDGHQSYERLKDLHIKVLPSRYHEQNTRAVL